MKIKRIKFYYTVCEKCGKGMQSDEKILYDGVCRYCYYSRY